MTVTDLIPCKKARGRMNVYVDGEFAFACYRETVLDQNIHVGCSLTAEEIDDIRGEDGREYAWRTAVSYIGRGMRTEVQVRRKLGERGVDGRTADATIAKLKTCDLLDDAEYASLLAEQLYRRYGRWLVRKKLRERGIDEATVAAVTERSCDPDALLSAAERQWEKRSSDALPLRRQKVSRALAAKGFEFDDIRRAIDTCAERS